MPDKLHPSPHSLCSQLTASHRKAGASYYLPKGKDDPDVPMWGMYQGFKR